MKPQEENHVTPEVVRAIAGLARIHLRDEEIDQLSGNLKDILRYITKLEKLDVSQVEPTSHVLPLKNVFRQDKIHPSLSQDAALSVAVAQKDGAFKVPIIIE